MNEINTTEESLRSEIEQLKRQLSQQNKRQSDQESAKAPTYRSLVVVLLLVAALAVAGYFLGYVPRQKREKVLAGESQSNSESLPLVNVVKVARSGTTGNLVLPGNIQ